MKLLYTILIPFMVFFACGSESIDKPIAHPKEVKNPEASIDYGSIKDSRNNQEYKTVAIGSYTWMTENLNATTFRDGTAIVEAKTKEEFLALTEAGKPAYCEKGFDKANGSKYGKLYNYYAISHASGLAPEGWHVSTDKEWDDLRKTVGAVGKYGAEQIKATGNEWLHDYNYSIKMESNSTGFSALPTRDNDLTSFGTSSEYTNLSADVQKVYFPGVDLSAYSHQILIYQAWKNRDMFAVRCVKD